MKISAELSLYPLNDQFGTPILRFIDKLKGYSEVEVKSNSMSTQIFGDYDEVMKVVSREMKNAFLTDDAVVMVMKLVNKDLR